MFCFLLICMYSINFMLFHAIAWHLGFMVVSLFIIFEQSVARKSSRFDVDSNIQNQYIIMFRPTWASCRYDFGQSTAKVYRTNLCLQGYLGEIAVWRREPWSPPPFNITCLAGFLLQMSCLLHVHRLGMIALSRLSWQSESSTRCFSQYLCHLPILRLFYEM